MRDLFQRHGVDAGLLVHRVLFAGTMALAHGLPKAAGFSEKSATFPDPLGVGSAASLALAIFGELVAPMAIVAGAYVRLAAIPAAITMVVAAFIQHAGDPFGKRELAILYLGAFVVLVLAGGGRFSVDGWRAARASKGG